MLSRCCGYRKLLLYVAPKIPVWPLTEASQIDGNAGRGKRMEDQRRDPRCLVLPCSRDGEVRFRVLKESLGITQIAAGPELPVLFHNGINTSETYVFNRSR